MKQLLTPATPLLLLSTYQDDYNQTATIGDSNAPVGHATALRTF